MLVLPKGWGRGPQLASQSAGMVKAKIHRYRPDGQRFLLAWKRGVHADSIQRIIWNKFRFRVETGFRCLVHTWHVGGNLQIWNYSQLSSSGNGQSTQAYSGTLSSGLYALRGYSIKDVGMVHYITVLASAKMKEGYISPNNSKCKKVISTCSGFWWCWSELIFARRWHWVADPHESSFYLKFPEYCKKRQ